MLHLVWARNVAYVMLRKLHKLRNVVWAHKATLEYCNVTTRNVHVRVWCMLHESMLHVSMLHVRACTSSSDTRPREASSPPSAASAASADAQLVSSPSAAGGRATAWYGFIALKVYTHESKHKRECDRESASVRVASIMVAHHKEGVAEGKLGATIVGCKNSGLCVGARPALARQVRADSPDCGLVGEHEHELA